MVSGSRSVVAALCLAVAAGACKLDEVPESATFGPRSDGGLDGATAGPDGSDPDDPFQSDGGTGPGAGPGNSDDGGSGAPTADGSTPGGPDAPSEIAFIYQAPFDPIDLSVTLDEANRTEAVVPATGGTLTTTGADGTTYVLEIPGDALLTEARIAMTPVESIEGLPFGDGTVFAVQLSPEGLAFNDFVSLSIAPAEPPPADEQIPFGYWADGEALSLVVPDLDPDSIKLRLMHFSGAGVARGALGELDAVRERLGGDIESRLESAIATAVQRARADRDSSALAATLEDYLAEYVELVVEPRIAAASDSCGASRLAIQTVLPVERTRELFGLGITSLAEDLAGLAEDGAEPCLEEEYALCHDAHVVHRMLLVYLGTLRQLMLLDVDSAALETLGWDYVDRCLRFELAFDSNATLDSGAERYESHVTSNVPLRIRPSYVLAGESAAVNESYAVTYPECTAEPTPGDGTFSVANVALAVAPFALERARGAVEDLLLLYDPGMTSESSTLTCGQETQPGPEVLWSQLFLIAHQDEVADGRLAATGWEVFGAELYASKAWQEAASTGESGSIAEGGSFTLYHRPAP